jgi:hypothetical protein
MNHNQMLNQNEVITLKNATNTYLQALSMMERKLLISMTTLVDWFKKLFSKKKCKVKGKKPAIVCCTIAVEKLTTTTTTITFYQHINQCFLASLEPYI